MCDRWQESAVPRGAADDRRLEDLASTGTDMHGAALVDSYGAGSVLHAGCGTGRVAIELSRRGDAVDVPVFVPSGSEDQVIAEVPRWLNPGGQPVTGRPISSRDRDAVAVPRREPEPSTALPRNGAATLGPSCALIVQHNPASLGF